MVAQVRAARDAGFASLWFPHHWLTHPMQMLQITPVTGYVCGTRAGYDDRAEYPDPAAAPARAGTLRGEK
jgi:alkanesulfonate monooxygenase SsuD/methylene tetrahydromethanopterin reductase-like flavin-dependent oxidoreductase (luciferase family)